MTLRFVPFLLVGSAMFHAGNAVTYQKEQRTLQYGMKQKEDEKMENRIETIKHKERVGRVEHKEGEKREMKQKQQQKELQHKAVENQESSAQKANPFGYGHSTSYMQRHGKSGAQLDRTSHFQLDGTSHMQRDGKSDVPPDRAPYMQLEGKSDMHLDKNAGVECGESTDVEIHKKTDQRNQHKRDCCTEDTNNDCCAQDDVQKRNDEVDDDEVRSGADMKSAGNMNNQSRAVQILERDHIEPQHHQGQDQQKNQDKQEHKTIEVKGFTFPDIRVLSICFFVSWMAIFVWVVFRISFGPSSDNIPAPVTILAVFFATCLQSIHLYDLGHITWQDENHNDIREYARNLDKYIHWYRCADNNSDCSCCSRWCFCWATPIVFLVVVFTFSLDIGWENYLNAKIISIIFILLVLVSMSLLQLQQLPNAPRQTDIDTFKKDAYKLDPSLSFSSHEFRGLFPFYIAQGDHDKTYIQYTKEDFKKTGVPISPISKKSSGSSHLEMSPIDSIPSLLPPIPSSILQPIPSSILLPMPSPSLHPTSATAASTLRPIPFMAASTLRSNPTKTTSMLQLSPTGLQPTSLMAASITDSIVDSVLQSVVSITAAEPMLQPTPATAASVLSPNPVATEV